ncbi:unnamed protein product [Paramecium sonneborni]|uniref:Uncharacterized protein n=1 Tax=Paramecium sonneborni TaxID=65129 RepID=A0A8S1QD16_9CILI|nr:unnamed protein product [Paramecium sonneborni]
MINLKYQQFSDTQISLKNNQIDKFKEIILVSLKQRVVQKQFGKGEQSQNIIDLLLSQIQGRNLRLNIQQCITDDFVDQIEDNIKQLFLEIKKKQNCFQSRNFQIVNISKNQSNKYFTVILDIQKQVIKLTINNIKIVSRVYSEIFGDLQVNF